MNNEQKEIDKILNPSLILFEAFFNKNIETTKYINTKFNLTKVHNPKNNKAL